MWDQRLQPGGQPGLAVFPCDNDLEGHWQHSIPSHPMGGLKFSKKTVTISLKIDLTDILLLFSTEEKKSNNLIHIFKGHEFLFKKKSRTFIFLHPET